MKYTVHLFDKTFYVVDEGSYEQGIQEVENAMINKTAIDLDGTLVIGSVISKIEKFGNREDYNSNLELQGFSKAIDLLEARNGKNMQEKEKNIAKNRDLIQDKLDSISGRDKEKREYLANVRLAFKLHTKEERRDWGIHDWELFNRAHPNPIQELRKLEGGV